jgi:hypothetical protein
VGTATLDLAQQPIRPRSIAPLLTLDALKSNCQQVLERLLLPA